MFAQSLAHGSDEAQQELQKLTEFLEREGNLGVIPVDLQKKVLSKLGKKHNHHLIISFILQSSILFTLSRSSSYCTVRHLDRAP